MLVYLTVITLYSYKNRYFLYIGLMIFLALGSFVLHGNGFLGHMILFISGILVSDMENAKDWGNNH